MSPQDIADALVGNLVTQIGQCPDDAIVTQPQFSRAVSPPALRCCIDSRAAGQSAFLPAVEFLSDELPIPGEDRIRFGDAGDFL
jgi:hypothetical protein